MFLQHNVECDLTSVELADFADEIILAMARRDKDEKSPRTIAMTTSTHASLGLIDGRLQAGARRSCAGRASISTVRPSRLADYIVFSALCLLAAIEIFRRLKNEMLSAYRPERHYMRGPGPKYREKRGQDRGAAPAGR